MGADGGMIAAMLGGPILSSLFAPDGQELSSFEGKGELDPTRMLGKSNALFNELGRILADRASQPVILPSAFAQQPGSYTGGGLPMPIGLTSVDPTDASPSLAGLGYMGSLANMFAGDQGIHITGPPGPMPDPPETNPDPTGPRPNEPAPALASMASAPPRGPRRRSDGAGLVRASDLIAADEGQPADDLDQAMGAVQLLMQSMRPQQTGALI